MITIVVAAAAAMTTTCPAEQASYVLRGAPTVTAHFRRVDSGNDWPSRLAMATTFAATRHTYWWLPWNGGTDGRQNVASTTDVTMPGWQPPSPDGGPRPYGNLEYLGTDATYRILDHVPVAGEPAPAHFVLLQLGNAVFDHGAAPGPGDPGSVDTKQFFDLVGCHATAP